jgi:hypothetical protein
MKSLDRISGFILLGLGIAIFVKSLTYPIGTFRAPGGGLFPLGISILIMVLAAVLTIRTFMKKQEAAPVPFFSGKEAPKRILIGCGALIGFRYLFPFIGFSLSTFVFVFALVKFLGHYSIGVSLLFSAVTTVAAYFLFQVWLKVPMPIPFWGF